MKVICEAREVCGKPDCFHATPHEYEVGKGCGNNKQCFTLDEVKKGNPDLASVRPGCEEIIQREAK